MIDQSKLKELYFYDPLTGSLLRKFSSKNGRWKKGDAIGSIDAYGYFETSINKKRYKVHRLIWLYHHGVWPDIIDHINWNRTDNRIENLRNTDKRGNSINSKIHSTNTSGTKGVSWNAQRGKWHSYMIIKGKRKHLGYFENLKDAENARFNEEKSDKEYEILEVGEKFTV